LNAGKPDEFPGLALLDEVSMKGWALKKFNQPAAIDSRTSEAS
jgi:hypothetical protein